jgi:hypothetical protein
MLHEQYLQYGYDVYVLFEVLQVTPGNANVI